MHSGQPSCSVNAATDESMVNSETPREVQPESEFHTDAMTAPDNTFDPHRSGLVSPITTSYTAPIAPPMHRGLLTIATSTAHATNSSNSELQSTPNDAQSMREERTEASKADQGPSIMRRDFSSHNQASHKRHLSMTDSDSAIENTPQRRSRQTRATNTNQEVVFPTGVNLLQRLTPDSSGMVVNFPNVQVQVTRQEEDETVPLATRSESPTRNYDSTATRDIQPGALVDFETSSATPPQGTPLSLIVVLRLSKEGATETAIPPAVALAESSLLRREQVLFVVQLLNLLRGCDPGHHPIGSLEVVLQKIKQATAVWRADGHTETHLTMLAQWTACLEALVKFRKDTGFAGDKNTRGSFLHDQSYEIVLASVHSVKQAEYDVLSWFADESFTMEKLAGHLATVFLTMVRWEDSMSHRVLQKAFIEFNESLVGWF